MSKHVQEVSTGYIPRTHQAILHKSFKRYNVIVCHRRFGKTHLALNEMVDQGLRNTRKNPQYAYIAPTYGQAKRVAWDLLKDYVKNIPGVVVNEADLRIDIPRPATGDKIRFILLGAENPGSLRGMYLDGVVLDEYAEMNPEIWNQVIMPTLVDREGWSIFIGTPKGQNHFYEIYETAKQTPGWFHAMYKASETGIIPQSELDSAKAIMADNEYMQEFECSFTAALIGAYYGKEMEKVEEDERITNVPYDPALPVTTYWDLGIDDTTVIWFCQNLGGREIRLIDYHEESGQGLDYYAKLLQRKSYVYEEHVLPHDANARELGTGKTRLEILRKLMGTPARIRVLERQSVEDGINAVRMILAKCWFDQTNCEKGIKSLKNYERVWDAKNKIFQQRPKHNWASHASDAFRMLALGLDESAPSSEERRRYPRHSQRDFDIV
jgi:phage terminase large subunit